MTELQRRIRVFRLHLMLRIASYSALVGLIVALVLVIVAPWLRDGVGLPGYWLTIALPAIFPAVYVAWTLFNRPTEQEIVLAADAWCRAEGSIVSAYELEREHPDSPFVKPIAARAVDRLGERRMPEPRLLRELMVALVVLLLLLWPSRLLYAHLQEAEQEEKEKELASKVDVPPEVAEQLARDAGTAAEKAREIRADQQERLADDIEQAARNAQAGGQDKERALREANSLVDRAKAQTESAEAREKAREALQRNDITRGLKEAIEEADPAGMQTEVEELAEQVYRKDGSIDRQAAEQLKQAVEEAQRAAPQDARLRRAAENLQSQLDSETLENADKSLKEARQRMQDEGMDPEAIKAALEHVNKLDKRALERALEEMAESSSPLRDLDVSGREMEELLKKMELGQVSPEDAREMAEAARQLSERMELDAETLRELLKKGQDFEGLEDAAKRFVEEQSENGLPGGPAEIPEWAKGAIPPEWEQAWKEQGAGGRNREAQPEIEGRDNGVPNGNRTDGEGGPGEGGPDADPTREIGGEGKKEGVDMTDTGKGEKDPEKDAERLDPTKAKDEEAWRKKTGREGTSSGINTNDEEERLPRRYRDAARKYFERN